MIDIMNLMGTILSKPGNRSENVMKSRKVSINDTHEMPIIPGDTTPIRGKGVGLIIPTMRTYPDSVMVMDVTHDVWDFMEVIKTGHSGSLVSLSGSPHEAFNRLESLKCSTANNHSGD
ncbi:type IV secretory system conjugative DNA transfer family protein [Serratia quinivorans]|uniref:type IV secretory system conjugative DNA transfer family protein n=1 Tax=Serratia quinivorans TaxID=137545 RepID=UPI003F9DE3CA